LSSQAYVNELAIVLDRMSKEETDYEDLITKRISLDRIVADGFEELMDLTKSVGTTAISGIALVYAGEYITLSGTLDVSIDAPSLGIDGMELIAQTRVNGEYSDIGYTSDFDGDGNWTISIPEFGSATTVFFSLGIQDTSDNWSMVLLPGTCSASSNNVSNIALSADLITLEGTITGTVNGSTNNDYSDWYVSANYLDPVSLDGTYIGEADVNPDGTWAMFVPAFDVSTKVDFYVGGPLNAMLPVQSTIVHDAAISGIGLTFVLETVPLGGTLIGFSNARKVYTCLNIDTMEEAQNSWVGDADVDGTTWSGNANKAFLGQAVYFLVVCSETEYSEAEYYVNTTPTYVGTAGATNIVLNYSEMEPWNP